MQNPEFSGKLQGQGTLVVSYPEKQTGEIVLDEEVQGEITVAATNGPLLRTHNKFKQEQTRFRLPPNEYLVAIKQGSKIAKKRIRLASNGTAVIWLAELDWQGTQVALASKSGMSATETGDDHSETSITEFLRILREQRIEFGAREGLYSFFPSGVMVGVQSNWFNAASANWTSGLHFSVHEPGSNDPYSYARMSHSSFVFGPSWSVPFGAAEFATGLNCGLSFLQQRFETTSSHDDDEFEILSTQGVYPTANVFVSVGWRDILRLGLYRQGTRIKTLGAVYKKVYTNAALVSARVMNF